MSAVARVASCVRLTRIPRFAYGGANAARMMPGFPSYCAGSLLIIASSITSCRCPRIGRRDFSHACPGNPPNQVRLRYGPSTSYHFLQTPPLASDALASRILFPVDGARPLASSGWVCQLRWANKKAAGTIAGSHDVALENGPETQLPIFQLISSKLTLSLNRASPLPRTKVRRAQTFLAPGSTNRDASPVGTTVTV